MKRYLFAFIALAVAVIAVIGSKQQPTNGAEDSPQEFIVTSEVPSAESVSNIEPAAGDASNPAPESMMVAPPSLQDAMEKMASDAPAPDAILPAANQ